MNRVLLGWLQQGRRLGLSILFQNNFGTNLNQRIFQPNRASNPYKGQGVRCSPVHVMTFDRKVATVNYYESVGDG